MNLDNPVIQLCAAGSRAEFEGRIVDARDLFQKAWESAIDDYDRCIAAHYRARYQENPEETLRWNIVALRYAEQVEDEEIKGFYPSLYLNLGHSYELLGDQINAKKYYDLAAELGVLHQPGKNNRWTR